MKKAVLVLFTFSSFLTHAQVQTEYYPNGKKQSEGNYVNGSSAGVVVASDGSTRQAPNQAKSGVWNYWYESGTKSAEENYTNGVTSGLWRTWYPSGNKSSEINYTSGNATFWYDNGKKQSEGNMVENRTFNGKWIGWHENGAKSFEGTYVFGKKDGEWLWFDENGKAVTKQTFKNDELIATQKL